MSRVLVNYAKSPVVLVAPHGYKGDDYNTDLITKIAAENINCSYLINQGWERHHNYSEEHDRADCNNYRHMANDTLADEFLLPYKRLCLRAKKLYGQVLVIFIHGVSNDIRKTSGIKNVDMILGYGLGTPESITCSKVIRECFMYELYTDDVNCAVGKSGGGYAGFGRHNMNQFWRKIEKDLYINSLQLEIVKDFRIDLEACKDTAASIGYAADKASRTNHFTLPYSFKYDSI